MTRLVALVPALVSGEPCPTCKAIYHGPQPIPVHAMRMPDSSSPAPAGVVARFLCGAPVDSDSQGEPPRESVVIPASDPGNAPAALESRVRAFEVALATLGATAKRDGRAPCRGCLSNLESMLARMRAGRVKFAQRVNSPGKTAAADPRQERANRRWDEATTKARASDSKRKGAKKGRG